MQTQLNPTHESLVVVLAVATVLDVIHVVPRLLAEQSRALCARHVKALLAAGLVALHAGAGGGAVLATVRLADVADLKQRKNHEITTEPRNEPGLRITVSRYGLFGTLSEHMKIVATYGDLHPKNWFIKVSASKRHPCRLGRLNNNITKT